MGRRVAKLGILALVSGVCMSQRYVPPPPPLAVDPCLGVANPLLPKDPAAKAQPVCPPPAAAMKTPVPAGTETTAADRFPFPGGTEATAEPSAPEQFPYPAETSKSPDAVPEGNTPRYVPDAPVSGEKPQPEGDGGSSSSSSSSASGSGIDPATVPADEPSAAGFGGRSHGRRALPKVSAVTPEDRVSEDLDVARFYSDRGNFQAAYLRAKDATKLMPEDAETHFALAQAAEKLKRKDEAAAEYELYLKLDPAGERKTAARRALSQLR